MGKKSRTKGRLGEQELVLLAKECGFDDAKRTAPMQSAGHARDYGDVAIPGLYSEAKRHKRVKVSGYLRELMAVERPGFTSVLFFRENAEPWRCALDARELLNRHRELLDLRAEVARLRGMLAPRRPGNDHANTLRDLRSPAR